MCKEDVRLSRALTFRSSRVNAANAVATQLIGARAGRAGIAIVAKFAFDPNLYYRGFVGLFKSDDVFAVSPIDQVNVGIYMSAEDYGQLIESEIGVLHGYGGASDFDVTEFFYDQPLESI